MEIQSLTPESFRNLAPSRIEFHSRLNLIVGGNGEGKTNLLEAIALLSGRPSFRTSDLQAAVEPGAAQAILTGRITGVRTLDVGDPETVSGTLGVSLTGRSREYFWNGQKVRQLRARQLLPTVFLTGSDLTRMTGSPAERRQAVDRVALSLDGEHLSRLKAYERARASKTELLARRASFDPDELAVYEDELVSAGAAIAAGRERAAQLLSARLREHAGRLGGHFEDLSLSVKSDVAATGKDARALQRELRAALASLASQERRAGRCLVGPHRDDILVLSGDVPVSERASSGETRTILLAWTLAELDIVREAQRAEPVLAFDDFDSEWDAKALAAFAEALPEGGQVFLTSARPEAVQGLPFPAGGLYEMRGGRLRRDGILGAGRSPERLSKRAAGR